MKIVPLAKLATTKVSQKFQGKRQQTCFGISLRIKEQRGSRRTISRIIIINIEVID